MDFLDRSGESRGRPSQGGRGRGDRRAASEVGRAAAAGRRAEARSAGQQGRDPLVHAGQDRQMVDAGRCRFRAGNPTHRHRQDSENRTARALQELSLADCGGLSIGGITPAARNFYKGNGLGQLRPSPEDYFFFRALAFFAFFAFLAMVFPLGWEAPEGTSASSISIKK